MFTGIVQDVGTVDRISRSKEHVVIRIRSSFRGEELRIGESINVNGACLTVERVDGHSFEASMSGETMSRTAMGIMRKGDKVNLERAMKADDRFGGHIVQGHIDATGIVRRAARRGGDVIVRISYPSSLEGLLVEKGSIAINGVSLTISALGRGWFEAALVPYTLLHTNLSSLRSGNRINIETDILGKYVRAFREKKDLWNKRN